MIQLKPRAKLTHGSSRVAPEVFFAISLAEKVFENYGLAVHVVSMLEGHNNHHRLGNEVDISVPVGPEAQEIVTDLQAALLDSFVVRLEPGVVHVVFTHA